MASAPHMTTKLSWGYSVAGLVFFLRRRRRLGLDELPPDVFTTGWLLIGADLILGSL